MAKTKTIFVRSATKDRKVALSEGDPAHPDGEAWVVGYPDLPDGSEDPANIVEVGETALVRQKLAAGDLLLADAPPIEAPPEAPPEKKPAKTPGSGA